MSKSVGNHVGVTDRPRRCTAHAAAARRGDGDLVRAAGRAGAAARARPRATPSARWPRARRALPRPRPPRPRPRSSSPASRAPRGCPTRCPSTCRRRRTATVHLPAGRRGLRGVALGGAAAARPGRRRLDGAPLGPATRPPARAGRRPRAPARASASSGVSGRRRSGAARTPADTFRPRLRILPRLGSDEVGVNDVASWLVPGATVPGPHCSGRFRLSAASQRRSPLPDRARRSLKTQQHAHLEPVGLEVCVQVRPSGSCLDAGGQIDPS